MTDVTSQGLFIVVAIIIFGVFVVLAYILFEDTLTPAMASMFSDAFAKSAQELSQSIIPVSDLKFWAGWSEAIKSPEYLTFTSDVFILDASTQTAMGVYVPYNTFNKNRDYELSFDYTVLEGNVRTFLGHITVSDNTQVFIDGKLTNSTWHMQHGAVFPNDKESHNIRVLFNTNRYDSPHFEYLGNSSGDRNVYIFNRIDTNSVLTTS